MRCRALLQGVHRLEDDGLAIAGVLERAHWETWLVSIHLLFRAGFLKEIAGDDIHYKRILAKELDLGYEYHDEWEGKFGKLNYKAPPREGVKQLLIDAGEVGDPDGKSGYDITYRVQSMFAAHAGLSALGLYMQYGEDSWSVVANPTPPFGIPAPTPGLHTAHLARYVFKAFGLPVEDVERIGDELLELARKSQAAS